MSQELIDSVKSLGMKTKAIETELGMPLNCLSGMLTGKKPIPLKWQLALKEFVSKKTGKRDSSGVKEDEVKPEFDFSNDAFLNVEKHTKYPSKERPTNIGERIEWDLKKKESDNKIREAWQKHKSKLK